MFKALKVIFALLLMPSFFGVILHAEGLTAPEKAFLDYIENHEKSEIDFLEKIVNINSGTMNHKGVKAVGQVFIDEFKALGMKADWVDMTQKLDRAGYLLAMVENGAPKIKSTSTIKNTGKIKGTSKIKKGKKLLLLGHLDTVFEKNSPFQKFIKKGHTATGPGIVDMKSGDVVILYALKALHAVGALEGVDISVMLTGDEEHAGRPLNISRKKMIELGKSHDAALSFESGVLDKAVIARRGIASWEIKATGVRAHSGQIFKKDVGAGAIFEAARILNAFYEEVKGEEYLSFNPGIIVGGTKAETSLKTGSGTVFGKTNIVANEVIIKGGIRTLSYDQLERAKAKMTEIVSRHLPQTDAEIIFEEGYPPMAPTKGNKALFEELKQINQDLNLPELTFFDPNERGAGDISFVAPYIDAIDGLGAIGKGSHRLSEELDLNSLKIMTKRAALLIFRLTHPN